MQHRNYSAVIKNVDWKLLQEQKKTLAKLLDTLPLSQKTPSFPNANLSNFWGLIELIENLQEVYEIRRVKTLATLNKYFLKAERYCHD